VLLAREFGWTIDDMRALRPGELAAILQELGRQVTIERYRDQRDHWAFLAAVITNGVSRLAGMFSKRKPKMVSPDDFMSKEAKRTIRHLWGQDSQEPEQKKDWSKHIKDAKVKGLRGPWREGGEKC